MTLDSSTLASISIYLPKVLIATLCGAIIGVEREFKDKPAGIRTMILVCVGCSILTTVSYHISPTTDPSRIISTILTGIGFIGAGVIVKNDDKIVGVTTAAFIWVVSALGIMVGAGETILPIILTSGLLLLSLILTPIENIIRVLNKRNNDSI